MNIDSVLIWFFRKYFVNFVIEGLLFVIKLTKLYLRSLFRLFKVYLKQFV